MIFKRILIGTTFLFSIFTSFSQDKVDIMCDVEGLPVVRFDETKDTMYVKYSISSSWQDVCLSHFKGGYKAFRAY